MSFSMRFFRALICTLVVFSAFARGEEKPREYTWHDYRAQALEFNRETLSVAYKAHGKHGAWDADAIKFLDRLAVYFTNSNLPEIYKKDPVEHAELIEAGQTIIEAGCDDPLVLYAYAVPLDDSGKDVDALKYVQAAVGGMESAGYPSVRVSSAAARLQKMLPAGEQREKLTPIIQRHTVQMACGKLSDIERRYVANRIGEMIEAKKRSDSVALLDQLRKAPEIDTWVLGVLDGRLEIKLAWDSRGGGWANTVTPEGWAGFSEHLGKARKCLMDAHKLAPQLPEAALAMITVAMGDGGQDDDVTTWFERAIGAQLDYTAAYGAMYNALLPRWGGSYEAMYDIGLRGMKTGRYDTEAPWQLVRAVEAIAADNGSGWTMLSQPTVYDTLAYVADQYAANEMTKPEMKSWYQSFHAAIAWRAEKYADARDLLEKLGDKAAQSAFQRVGSKNPPAAIGNAYAMAGAHAAEVRKAEDALKAGQFEEAVKMFRELLAGADQPAPAKIYFEARIALADQRLKFQKGEWFEIQPKKSLAGWSRRDGKWSVDKSGALLGESTQNLTALVLEEPVGDRVELRGTLDSIGKEAADYPGVVIGRGGMPLLFVTVARGGLHLSGINGYKQFIRAEALDDIHGEQKFVFTYDRGKISLALNDKVVIENPLVPPALAGDQIGVCAAGMCKFTDLKVRKLPDDAK